MSKLTLTMKSLLAIGAATALTLSASADEPKSKKPTSDEAKALVTGGGGGKVDVQDISIIKYGNVEDKAVSQGTSETLKYDGVESETKDRAKTAMSDGEDRLTENVSIASGPKGMMPEVEKDAAEKIGGNDPIDGVDIIVKERPEKK